MIRTVLVCTLAMSIAACATSPSPKPAAAKPAAVKFVADPYPSTYKPYPSSPTAIRNVTIFDGEGKRFDRGTIFMSGGKITSV
ncbi:MAG: amidohydrolase, partial [Sphingomonadaceae bacterium]